MKRALFANLGRALAACLIATINAAAQESPAPRPETDKLVVQVVSKKGGPSSYLDVPGCAWYAWFGSTPAAASRAAADTVQAVDVKAKLEGVRVELKVGVYVGERFFDRLDEVGTYNVALGETVEARDLERVGVAPFVFKVLRVSASDTAPPVVDNRTQSIAAAVTDFTPTPLPRAKLTLTNLSQKRVRAVVMKTTFQGRRRTSSIAFEPEGRPLMEPGGTHERKVGSIDGRGSGSSFTPEAIDGVVIAAVVFDDYTFEGDADSAAQKVMMDEGSRLQLPRLLQLLRDAHAANDAETAEAVRKLKAALNVLDDTAPQASVDAVLAALPALPPSADNTSVGDRFKGGIEVSMHFVKTELLKDLEQFEKKFRAAPADNSFRRWLAEQQARHESWLARL